MALLPISTFSAMYLGLDTSGHRTQDASSHRWGTGVDASDLLKLLRERVGCHQPHGDARDENFVGAPPPRLDRCMCSAEVKGGELVTWTWRRAHVAVDLGGVSLEP